LYADHKLIIQFTIWLWNCLWNLYIELVCVLSQTQVQSNHVWCDSSTPSQKYVSRSNAGEVVSSFPVTLDSSLLKNNWRESRELPLAVKMCDEYDALVAPYKFMFQKTVDKAYGMHYVPSVLLYAWWESCNISISATVYCVYLCIVLLSKDTTFVALLYVSE